MAKLIEVPFPSGKHEGVTIPVWEYALADEKNVQIGDRVLPAGFDLNRRIFAWKFRTAGELMFPEDTWECYEDSHSDDIAVRKFAFFAEAVIVHPEQLRRSRKKLKNVSKAEKQAIKDAKKKVKDDKILLKNAKIQAKKQQILEKERIAKQKKLEKERKRLKQLKSKKK